MHRIHTLLIATLLVTAAAVPGTALAQQDDEDETFFGGLVSDDGADGYLTLVDVTTTVAKWSSSGARVYTRLTTDTQSASTYANETAEVFNANNQTFVSYANERLDASAEYDTLAVHFHDRDGGNATRYILADVADGNYTSARMTDSLGTRSVDYHIRADWYVSQHASDELETFTDEYASEDRNLSATYKASLIAEYGGGISSGLWTNSTGEAA